MTLRSTENLSLFTNLHLEQEVLSQIYSSISLTTEGKNLIESRSALSDDKRIYSFTKIPSYLKIDIATRSKWTKRVFPTVNGYAIQIGDFKDTDEYLRQQSRKQRENINRARRRLEACFDVNYKVFQNQIKEKEYRFLMNQLRFMIVKRFEQRGQKSSSLAVWNKVFNTSFELMKQKKASLFVIYDKNTPIAISFNYIYDRLLFGYISSYNLDYSKFSLGQIVIYKLLEWCLKNNFTQYDMGWGDLDYKKWWCNKIYRFSHHIYYPKNSIPGFVQAYFQGNRSRLLAFLISKGVNTYWNRLKKMVKQNTETKRFGIAYRFMEISLEETEKFDRIDLGEKNLPVTNRIIKDFLFSTCEHSNDVKLHYANTKDLYVLKGKKSAKAILFNPAN